MRNKGLLWVVVDGLAHSLLDEIAEHGTQPSARLLSELADAGKVFPTRPLFPNCQTPPSLFTIWSGLRPVEHAILGYEMPDFSKEDMPSVNAFEHWPKEHELAWDNYAARGMGIRLSAIPFVEYSRLGDALLSSSIVYGPGHTLRPFVIDDHGTHEFDGNTIGFNVERDGFSVALTTTGGHCVRHLIDGCGVWEELSLEGCSGLEGETRLSTYVAVFNVEGQYRLCCLGYSPVAFAGSDPLQVRQHLSRMAYCSQPLTKLYRKERLGKKAENGGDGSAEDILLSALWVMHDSFVRDIAYTARKRDYDLYCGYYPLVDLLLHETFALCMAPGKDVDSLGYSVKVKLLNAISDWIAEIASLLVDEVAKGANAIMNSDHGMQEVQEVVYLNKLLLDEGLVSLSAEGAIDINKSRCFYHQSECGVFVINDHAITKGDLDTVALENKVTGLCASLGIEGVHFDALDEIVHPGIEGRHLRMIFPPDGVRFKSDITNDKASKSGKSGDHTMYSSISSLQGVLIDFGNNGFDSAGHETSIVELHQIKNKVTKWNLA